LEAALETIGAYGEFVSSSESREYSAEFSLKTPLSMFGSVMTTLRSLGEVVEESSGESYSADAFLDNSAALSARRQELADVSALLDKTRTSEDLLKLSRRLDELIESIETLESELRAAKKRGENPEINIFLSEKPKATVADKTLGRRAADNFIASVNGVGSALAEIAVWTARSSARLIAAVAAVAAFLCLKKIRGRKNAKPNEIPEPPESGAEPDETLPPPEEDAKTESEESSQ
jgi:hypothetical protein